MARITQNVFTALQIAGLVTVGVEYEQIGDSNSSLTLKQ